MHTIAVGNPFDGIELVGIYEDHDSAVEYADTHLSGEEWNVVEIRLIGCKVK